MSTNSQQSDLFLLQHKVKENNNGSTQQVFKNESYTLIYIGLTREKKWTLL